MFLILILKMFFFLDFWYAKHGAYPGCFQTQMSNDGMKKQQGWEWNCEPFLNKGFLLFRSMELSGLVRATYSHAVAKRTRQLFTTGVHLSLWENCPSSRMLWQALIMMVSASCPIYSWPLRVLCIFWRKRLLFVRLSRVLKIFKQLENKRILFNLTGYE